MKENSIPLEKFAKGFAGTITTIFLLFLILFIIFWPTGDAKGEDLTLGIAGIGLDTLAISHNVWKYTSSSSYPEVKLKCDTTWKMDKWVNEKQKLMTIKEIDCKEDTVWHSRLKVLLTPEQVKRLEELLDVGEIFIDSFSGSWIGHLVVDTAWLMPNDPLLWIQP